MTYTLDGKTVVVIGRPSGIAATVIDRAVAAGGNVVAAGRDAEAIRAALGDSVRAETLDITDDQSIRDFGARVGQIDHLVTTASARARGKLSELTRTAILRSLDTKVVGPLMLASILGPSISPNGSLTLFSGVAAFKPAIGYLGVALTNGAADFLTRSLALELAPIRVNAISPGVVDTGIWDNLGEAGKATYFTFLRTHNPARRIGTVEDIADAVLFAMTNSFLTGVTLRIDGGEPLT
ncbi:SDR family oxidoreductase [Actinoplanes sp. NPDC049596]|uniref:SDR family oxidoreductase n=1 Tax=unclassified Actinoplanes TaxID=2626549 RepID=UPI003420C36C